MAASSPQSAMLSPEEYLAWESNTPVKHEYLGGKVYALTDFKNIHNKIAGNVMHAFHRRQRLQKFQVFPSNTKVRLTMPNGQLRFYYPDTQIVCGSYSPQSYFIENPVVVAEVLAPSTRRTDMHEKLDAYTTIPTLEAYVLVDSNSWCVTVYQRMPNSFKRTELLNKSEILRIPRLDLEVPIAEFYVNVSLLPLSDEELAEYGS